MKRSFIGALNLTLAAMSLALTACIGGGGGDTPAPQQQPEPAPRVSPTEGVYEGATSNNGAFQMIVLENGEFWAPYVVGDTVGFVQGSVWTGNAKDFGYAPALPATVQNVTFDQSTKDLAGEVHSSTGVLSFNGGALPTSYYTYERPASLAEVAGGWALSANHGATLILQVEAHGAFSGVDTSTACQFTGTVQPRATRNVFDVWVTFGAAGCMLPGHTARGVAITYPTGEPGDSALIVAVTDNARTVGLIAGGSRSVSN